MLTEGAADTADAIASLRANTLLSKLRARLPIRYGESAAEVRSSVAAFKRAVAPAEATADEVRGMAGRLLAGPRRAASRVGEGGGGGGDGGMHSRMGGGGGFALPAAVRSDDDVPPVRSQVSGRSASYAPAPGATVRAGGGAGSGGTPHIVGANGGGVPPVSGGGGAARSLRTPANELALSSVGDMFAALAAEEDAVAEAGVKARAESRQRNLLGVVPEGAPTGDDGVGRVGSVDLGVERGSSGSK